ncbi:MAG: organomercurial lyase [Microthrixaceae bacterium]
MGTPRCLPLDGDDDELAVQKAGFLALLGGETVTAAELGVRAGLGPTRGATVVAALLARESATVAGDGRVDGIAGLTLRPTRHRLTVAGSTLHTWCAFDSVGIPASLAADAVAVTSCGGCGERIEVRITAGEPPASEVRGWMPAAVPGETALITNFCSLADLFCSEDHLRIRRDPDGPGGDICTLGEFAEIGRATWEHCTV